MEVDELDGPGYTQIMLGGLYIVTINSAKLYWLNQGKDQFFPLLPTEDLDTEVVTLLIEAPGYLVFPRDATFKYEEVGPFQRFGVQFLGLTVAQLS